MQSIVEKTLEEVDNELMGTTCGEFLFYLLFILFYLFFSYISWPGSFRRGAEFSGDVTDLPFL